MSSSTTLHLLFGNRKIPEKIFQSKLNTNKPIPAIPLITVDNYMHFAGKDTKGEYFLSSPLKIIEI